MSLNESYRKDLDNVVTDPDLKDKPLMIFYQMMHVALTYGKLTELQKRTGFSYSTLANWLYSGVMPNATNFIKALSAMGYDVKIVKRNENV